MKLRRLSRVSGLLLVGSCFLLSYSTTGVAADPPDPNSRPWQPRPIPGAPPGRPPNAPPPGNPGVPGHGGVIYGGGRAAIPTAVDPVSGLPVNSWKDPDWPEPDKMLPEFICDAIPVRLVADQLRIEFKNAFDVLIPSSWPHPTDPSVSIDPGSTPVRLQLRNVSAGEIFNGMNMMFEAENAPYRWELRLNGTRPMARLRVLPELVPTTPPPPAPPSVTRMVHFVGDLLEGEPSGTAMEDLVKTVSDIYQKAYGSPKSVIQFHKDAQLLIVSGTKEQIGFVQLTLSALREKARFKQLSPPQPNPSKAKTEENKQ